LNSSKTPFGLFSKTKKAKGVKKKSENYKFGLKKAKLATLLVTLRLHMIVIEPSQYMFIITNKYLE